jgi:hypothetical protein
MRALLTVLLAVSIVGGLAASGAADSVPPGATAQCRDGTYSFSQHRSGTCADHGGVAQWLQGSSSNPRTATSSSAASSPAQVALGRTVLLAHRTKTRGCKLAATPDRRCSPGAYYSGLGRATICSSSFRTSAVRNVPVSEKHAVEAEYGLTPKSYGRTLEIDHIVSLELGGSNDIANLYPEEGAFADGAPGFHIKDKLENRAHAVVCTGAMTLASVRRGIARDWQALYKRVYGIAPVGDR